MVRKLRQVFGGLTRPRPNLHVLTPLVVPLPGSSHARDLNRRLLVFQIRRVLRKISDGPVQFWSFTPDVAYLLGNFGETKIVYYCVDDHSQFTGYDPEQVLRDEEDLCRRSDLVVTTSMALQEAKAPLNPNTILVPHGVDYEHFSRAVTEDLPVPPDIAGIPHPRLGFFGLIRDWVDLVLLAEVARRRGDWHFVMIGDSSVGLAPYQHLPNMHFLGRKPYGQLPAYCQQFDVGLIPFKINDLTRAVSPIKFREYLSAGLPVVSTPLPEVRRYGHLAEVAACPTEFEAAIAKSLASSAWEREQRAAAMSEEIWPKKVAEICLRLDSNVDAQKAMVAAANEQ
jgi:glycosyltransferase involved in cell wall biosynthesis